VRTRNAVPLAQHRADKNGLPGTVTRRRHLHAWVHRLAPTPKARATQRPCDAQQFAQEMRGRITGHLGYDKHDPAGKNGGNSRNGTRAKTVLTDVGPVEIAVPRDREGSFEPRIVKKRQKRLSGVDEMVISLAAKGLTTGEVQAHLAEVYGAEVSRQTISTITDKVLDGLAEWQNRPLDAVYPVIFIDAIHVKIRVLSTIL
jgi:transposase-like protein